jgi:hypothetical protein
LQAKQGKKCAARYFKTTVASAPLCRAIAGVRFFA